MITGESWTIIIVLLTWVALIGLGIAGIRRITPRVWRQQRAAIIFAGLVLLLPLVTLAARYGPVSCASLNPENACVCYAFSAADADSAEEKRALFAKADDLCPGHEKYRAGAGRG